MQKIFRTTMLFQFVNVLLQVLVHKSHDLLQEEIGIATYNMASVDFDGFYSAFLPEFLASCDGVDSNQKNVLGRNFKMDRVRRGPGCTGLPQDMSPGRAFCSQPHPAIPRQGFVTAGSRADISCLRMLWESQGLCFLEEVFIGVADIAEWDAQVLA